MLIGITGKAGTGKDTIGLILKEEHELAIMSFAFPIKNAVAHMLGVPYAKWEDREWKEAVLPEWECSPRYLAQTLGTEWGRLWIKETIWIDLAMSKAHNVDPTLFKGVCITDVRFQNEADRIRNSGGFIIHVKREDSDASTKLTAHASEYGVTQGTENDFLIKNDGTKQDLVPKVRDIVEWIAVTEARREAI